VTKEQIAELIKENLYLKEEIKRILEINRVLEERLRQLEEIIQSNSSNSSKAPSRDTQKEKQLRSSRRNKSDRNKGGQRGHKGNHLKMVSNPTNTVSIGAEVCNGCGQDLTMVEGQVLRKAQLFDIPPIDINVIEYHQIEKCCPCCQMTNKGALPKELGTAATAYGENLQRLIVYLNVRQFVPVHRLKELIQTVYGLHISTGYIVNVLSRMKNQLKGNYDTIRKEVEKSKVGGMDETGCAVNGELQWLWTFQNSEYVLLFLSENRGIKTINEVFPKHFPNTMLVSDCWRSYFKVKCKGHQICLAHLMRECNKLIDFQRSTWARDLRKVFIRIYCLTKLQKIAKHEKQRIESDLDELLARPMRKASKQIQNLKKRLTKYRTYLTTCLYHRKVPPDNNASERAIRNTKIKNKISGGFRNPQGGEAYCVLRSIIDSAIKQNIHPFTALSNPNILFKT
jgi:transposase